MPKPQTKTIFILSASSDIGLNLMEMYLNSGASVIGTYRNKRSIQKFDNHPKAHLIEVDLHRTSDIAKIGRFMSKNQLEWDLFIASNGTMEPIGPFMQIEDQKWQESININALIPIRILKTIYPHRNRAITASACFFAGGGTNSPFDNYSAYCLSKILLIKMCELLDSEVKDLKTFILGPGYTKTKIHKETIDAGEKSGQNLEKTRQFFDTKGTSMQEIYDCIAWCIKQDKTVIGGRNFSIVHDQWKGNDSALISELTNDKNQYKLRRYNNSI